MILYASTLSKLYYNNLIFESLNGSIYISGINQPINMNGVSNGKISFITNTHNGTYQYITINDNPLIFSSNNEIEFISYYGINIIQNITNENGTITKYLLLLVLKYNLNV